VAVSLVLAVSLLPTMAERADFIRELEERICQFPSFEVAYVNHALSSDHLQWVQQARAVVPLHRRKLFAAHLADAERFNDAWCWLSYAKRNLKDAKYSLEGKCLVPYINGFRDTFETRTAAARQSIDKLEKILGKEAFHAGRMPPPVPMWRFQWVD
jgi:hypothetical protein